MISLVHATPEAIDRALPERPKQTMRAILAMDGEHVLGIAGIYRQDAALVLFGQISDELRAHRRVIVRAIRLVMKMATRVKIPIVAMADPEIDGSDILLEHMGFKPFQGRVYIWHGPR